MIPPGLDSEEKESRPTNSVSGFTLGTKTMVEEV